MIDYQERLQVIASNGLFAGLSGDLISAIASISVVKSFARGDWVYLDGDVASGAFLLVSGQLSVCRNKEDRQDILETIEAGVLVGQTALVTRIQRINDLRAERDSIMLFLEREKFLRLLAGNQVLAKRLHASLENGMHAMMQGMEAVARDLEQI